jgi:hypothetical protein
MKTILWPETMWARKNKLGGIEKPNPPIIESQLKGCGRGAETHLPMWQGYTWARVCQWEDALPVRRADLFDLRRRVPSTQWQNFDLSDRQHACQQSEVNMLSSYWLSAQFLTNRDLHFYLAFFSTACIWSLVFHAFTLRICNLIKIINNYQQTVFCIIQCMNSRIDSNTWKIWYVWSTVKKYKVDVFTVFAFKCKITGKKWKAWGLKSLIRKAMITKWREAGE